MMNAFLHVAEQAATDLSTQDTEKAGRKRMQSQLLLEMMSIDRECAITTMKSWAKFLEVGECLISAHSLSFLLVETIFSCQSRISRAMLTSIGSGRQHSKRFTCLKDYLPYRIMDVGEMLVIVC